MKSSHHVTFDLSPSTPATSSSNPPNEQPSTQTLNQIPNQDHHTQMPSSSSPFLSLSAKKSSSNTNLLSQSRSSLSSTHGSASNLRRNLSSSTLSQTSAKPGLNSSSPKKLQPFNRRHRDSYFSHTNYYDQEKEYLQKFTNGLVHNYPHQKVGLLTDIISNGDYDDDDDDTDGIDTDSTPPLNSAVFENYSFLDDSHDNNSNNNSTNTSNNNDDESNDNTSNSHPGTNNKGIFNTSSNVNNSSNNNLSSNSTNSKASSLLINSINDSDSQSQPYENYENLHERLEWQAMLQSVLTGDVVASEKRRLKTGGAIMAEDDLWIGIRARMCDRTVENQKRLIEDARSTVDSILQEVMQFKVSDPTNFDLCREEVHQVLDKIHMCEMLWTSTQAFKANSTVYRDPEFQRLQETLNTWVNVTDRVIKEVDLLRKWAGNPEIDPRKPMKIDANNSSPMSEPTTLADRILTSKSVEEVFTNKMTNNIDPVVAVAREGLSKYGHEMQKLRLPVYRQGLQTIISFLMILIHEVIRSRLAFSQSLNDLTMMLIDQTISDISLYLKIASVVKQRTLEYIKPLPNGASWVDFQPDPEFDQSILNCIEYFYELSQNKILDTPIHHYGRGFKDVKSLEPQYKFLDDVAKQIRNGRIVVAIQSSALATRMLTNMLSYWEKQTNGPVVHTPAELQRWQSATTEQVRKAQLILQRFYQLLSNNYKNAIEFSFQTDRFKVLLESLKNTNHFLVVPTNATLDAFIIADPSLAEEPHIIEELLRGYSGNKNIFEDYTPKYIILFQLKERQSWDGPVVEFTLSNSSSYSFTGVKNISKDGEESKKDRKEDEQQHIIKFPEISSLDPGRLRIVCEGGTNELKKVRKHLASQNIPLFDNLEIIAEPMSQLKQVNFELNRMRKLLYKALASIVTDACSFRKKFKGHQEIVQNMFVFARELGQRGMHIMDKRRKANLVFKLINLCIEWLTFICDDCVATDLKTYRWTVVAIEFTMLMTQGVTIIGLSNDQFTQLRLRVAGCMTLLILHFDIMGARSTAARRQRLTQQQFLQNLANINNGGAKFDAELVEQFHAQSFKHVQEMEQERNQKTGISQQNMGKVLDESDDNAELVTYLVSNFFRVSVRWKQGRFIGAGSFGSVYTAVNMDTGEVMAVKEIRMQDASSMKQALKSIKDEMTVLEMLDHLNIVKYYGVEVHRDRVFLFMEYCQSGSLARLLECGRIEDETVIQVYTMQMLEGLAYLHQMGIVHRDVKPENILLDHMGIIKFVDFGAAKMIAKRGQSRLVSHSDDSVNGGMSSGSSRRSSSPLVSNRATRSNSMIGTPMYMSPEVITGKCERHLQSAIDIWSLGCCVLEMATGRRPWANLDNEWAIMYHIAAGHLPKFPTTPDQLSAAGIKFLYRTFEQEPSNRPTALMLLQDEWIKKIRVTQAIEKSDDMGE